MPIILAQPTMFRDLGVGSRVYDSWDGRYDDVGDGGVGGGVAEALGDEVGAGDYGVYFEVGFCGVEVGDGGLEVGLGVKEDESDVIALD